MESDDGRRCAQRRQEFFDAKVDAEVEKAVLDRPRSLEKRSGGEKAPMLGKQLLVTTKPSTTVWGINKAYDRRKWWNQGGIKER